MPVTPRQINYIAQLAKRALDDAQSFSLFCGCLKFQLDRCLGPPQDPSVPNDQLSRLDGALCALDSLRKSLVAGLIQRHSDTPGALQPMLDVLPSITSFLSFYATEIICATPPLFSRISYLFHSVAGPIIACLLLSESSIASALYETPGTLGSDSFLSCFIPTLLFTSDLVPEPERSNALYGLFDCLRLVLTVRAATATMTLAPVWRRQTITRLEEHPTKYASIVIGWMTSKILELEQAPVPDLTKSMAISLIFPLRCLGELFAWAQTGVELEFELRRMGLLRLICKAVVAIAESKALARLLLEATDEERTGMLHDIVSPLRCFSERLATNVSLSGFAAVRVMLGEGILQSLLRFEKLLCCLPVHETKEDYQNSVKKTLHIISPYLVYYSVLKQSIRARRELEQLDYTRCQPEWKLFGKRIGRLQVHYDGFKEAKPHICDSKKCPNKKAHPEKLTRCKGCSVYFYCSVMCQRFDWEERHRETCASMERGRIEKGCLETSLPSRDMAFLVYLSLVLMKPFASQPAYLVRHIDMSGVDIVVKVADPEGYAHMKDYEGVMIFVQIGWGLPVYLLYTSGPELEENFSVYRYDDAYPILNCTKLTMTRIELNH